jgi:uncharacterized protein YydD (DUF2326 family)
MPFPALHITTALFEALDDRKKENLIGVIRQYTQLGIQSILTAIDSDLPNRAEGNSVFSSEDIVLLLHDEDETGRLFKMKSW